MTRAPCRRRTGNSVLRAENFGDLMTVDHKVFKEGCESQDNHRYWVAVPDLATQWSQSCRAKHKNFSGEGKEFHGRFQSRVKSRTLFTQTIRWNLVHLVKIYHGIIVLPHFVDLGQMGLPKGGARTITEGTSAVLFAIRLGWKVVGWLCGIFSTKCSRSLGRWENSVWKTIWRTIQRAKFLLEQWLNIIRLQKTSQGSTNLFGKSCQQYSSDMR